MSQRALRFWRALPACLIASPAPRWMASQRRTATHRATSHWNRRPDRPYGRAGGRGGARAWGGIGRRDDRSGSGRQPPSGLAAFDDVAALARESDVVIDFTQVSAAQAHARALRDAGTAWVLGTSGLSAADEAAVAEAARAIPVVYAANFSPGVALVLAVAERMGAALPADAYDAEIVEMHHRQKVDAPSGTAVAIGRRWRKAWCLIGRGEGKRTRRPHGSAQERRDRVRGTARRSGSGRAHPDLRCGVGAHRTQPPCVRSAQLRHGSSAGGVLGGWTGARLYGMADVLGVGGG